MEVFRESLMEAAIAGETIHAYLHWVDGTLTRPRCVTWSTHTLPATCSRLPTPLVVGWPHLA